MVEYTIDEVKLLKTVAVILEKFKKESKISLSDYQQVLEKQGRNSEHLLGVVLTYLPKVERWYREKRGEYIQNNQEGLPKNAYERECVIKSETAKFREIRDTMVSAKIFADSRRNYIQSLLKSANEKNSKRFS